jgi:hypothetical protein
MSEDIKKEIKEEEIKIIPKKGFFDWTLQELKREGITLGDIYKFKAKDQEVTLGFTWTHIIRIVNKSMDEDVLSWGSKLNEAFPFIVAVFQL